MPPGMYGRSTPPGHCRQCGQPSGSCGCKQCRREAKELVVTAQQGRRDENQEDIPATPIGMIARAMMESAGQINQGQLGTGSTFIGGGCCVSISVEYMPSLPTVQSTVIILVQDSDGTTLAWMRTEQPGSGYQVKECVMTTNPGARMLVLVLNATARVRWCEIFSC